MGLLLLLHLLLPPPPPCSTENQWEQSTAHLFVPNHVQNVQLSSFSFISVHACAQCLVRCCECKCPNECTEKQENSEDVILASLHARIHLASLNAGDSGKRRTMFFHFISSCLNKWVKGKQAPLCCALIALCSLWLNDFSWILKYICQMSWVINSLCANESAKNSERIFTSFKFIPLKCSNQSSWIIAASYFYHFYNSAFFNAISAPLPQAFNW